jgi:hypothetical protein
MATYFVSQNDVFQKSIKQADLYRVSDTHGSSLDKCDSKLSRVHEFTVSFIEIKLSLLKF